RNIARNIMTTPAEIRRSEVRVLMAMNPDGTGQRARIEDFRIARDKALKQEKLPAVRKRILTSSVATDW
ncbi:MAG: hypothetical protein ACC628_26500, partial [Pirellulaceae bacterium]